MTAARVIDSCEMCCRSMKREMTVEISSEGFIRTGVKSDVCQVFECYYAALSRVINGDVYTDVYTLVH